MNKLITSLACGTVLSMSVMGASYASSANGSASLGGIPAVTTGTMDGNLMNGTTGTLNTNESIMRDKIRTNDSYREYYNNTNRGNYNTNNYNNTVSPLANTTPTGRYRTTSTTTNNANTNRGSNWGWLGLLGLLGLVGMRSRSGERN